MRIRKIGAYTLIELFVVALLLGTLVAVSIPSYVSSLERNRETVANANAKAIATAIQSVFVRGTSKGYLDAGINDMVVAKAMGGASIPTNPCTGGNSLEKDYKLQLSDVKATLAASEGTLCNDSSLPAITLIGL
jgi:type II secretory pathway pseudopilin PulG